MLWLRQLDLAEVTAGRSHHVALFVCCSREVVGGLTQQVPSSHATELLRLGSLGVSLPVQTLEDHLAIELADCWLCLRHSLLVDAHGVIRRDVPHPLLTLQLLIFIFGLHLLTVAFNRDVACARHKAHVATLLACR